MCGGIFYYGFANKSSAVNEIGGRARAKTARAENCDATGSWVPI